ncbi:MAG: cytochrome c biogenesis protein CcdA [Bdellovibrionota bacterium]
MHSITDFLTGLLGAGNEQLGFIQALGAVCLAYLGGILSSLTPCVYPMIPITVSVVGGIGPTKKSWHAVWVRSLVYVSGMAVAYSFLGVLAGLTGRIFGSFTNTAGWYFIIGLIMNVASLVMLDIIPFDPLTWWETIKNKLRLASSKKPVHHRTSTEKEEVTLLGAFCLGASSGFIAAPCTTPVLTSILAFIAKSQSIGLGLLLMMSFAFGLGTLLLVIAISTGALQILPRSGRWMKHIKILSGLLLLWFAEYLLYQAGKLGGF